MVAWMPIAGGYYVGFGGFKTLYIIVEDRDDFVAVFNGQGAAGQKIFLYVGYQKSIRVF
jgi:hypothetical protein